MSLSYDEALAFLKDVLEIPCNLVCPLSSSRESEPASTDSKSLLLHRIINAFLAIEPFQSISLMSTDATSRKRPEWPEIKRSMLLKQGGLCYSLNSFAFVLLKTLGYDASLAHSTVVCGMPCPNNHVVILIRSLLTPGDVFLADVGTGFPMARAVPLDFEKESPVFVDSYHTYKLQKRSRNKISLLQQPVRSVLQKGTFDWNNIMTINSTGADVSCKTSPQPSAADCDLDIPESDWREFYFFDPTEEYDRLDEFYPCFDVCYGDVTKLTMHSSLRALCWPGGRFQAILHSKLSLEKPPGELLKYEISDIVMDPEDTGTTIQVESDSTISSQPSDSNHLGGEDSFPESRDSKSTDLKGSWETEAKPAEEDVKIMKAYQRLFPQFPSDMLVSALKNWRKSVTPQDLPSYLN